MKTENKTKQQKNKIISGVKDRRDGNKISETFA
jgi:hypothetical protein